MNRISVAIALAVSFCALRAAQAEPKWNLTRSGVLTVIGDQPAPVLRDIAIQIEQFRAVVGGLIHDADRPPSVPTIVFVVGQRKSLVPIVPLYNGKPISLAGYLGQADDLNVMALSLEGFEESSAVAFHEYTHLLVQNAVRWMPVWLNEGLAEYYGSYTLIDRGKTAVIGRPKPEHILLLREKYLPIGELITVDQSSPMYNEGQPRSIFYAESWAAAHYLMTTRPDGQAAVNAYVTAVAEGRAPVDAFRSAFGVTPEEFDKELKVYVRRLTFLAQRITMPEKLAVAEPAPGRPMTAGEVEAWLGTAQLRMKRTSEATPRIERAALQAPGATSQLALGLLRLDQQLMPQALEAFARAAELAPDDFLIQYVSGVSMLHDGERGDLPVVDPDGFQLTLKQIGRIDPERQDVAWLCRTRDATVVGDRFDGLTVDLENDRAPLDIAIGGRADRFDTRHEDAFRPAGQIEPFERLTVEIAHGEPERYRVLLCLGAIRHRRRPWVGGLARRRTFCQLDDDRLLAAVADDAKPSRGAGNASGDLADQLIVVADGLIVE